MTYNSTEDQWKPQLKRYPHIGEPLTKADLHWIKAYVSKEENIVKHKFMPLIHRTIHQRRFRPTDCATKTPTGKRMREGSVKDREIYFASHFDSIIYSYYSHILNKAYE